MHLMAISCSHKRVNRKIKRWPVRGSVRIVLDRKKGNRKEKAPITGWTMKIRRNDGYIASFAG